MDCKGAYPSGYLAFLKENGWWGEKRIHLCSGRVKDDGFKVDIRPEMNPNLVADARETGLEAGIFDCVIIDPPYSADLAEQLYDTRKYYGSVNQFIKEGIRLAKAGGFIVSLSYEIPRLQKECDMLAVWGIYEVPTVSSMRCMVVFRKRKANALNTA